MRTAATAPRLRLDKWLWAARLYKTRSLAADEIAKGRVAINEQPAKAAREVHVGDRVVIRHGPIERTLRVLVLSAIRGPAVIAQTLYEETADSVAERRRAAELRRLAPEPAHSIEQGRPTKRDRRDLQQRQVQWQRWSASIDDIEH